MSNKQTTNQNVETNNDKNGQRNQLKKAALDRCKQEKEKLRKDLENVKVVYVSYLNQSGTEMNLFFINKDDKGEPFLDKIWITAPYFFDETNKDQYGLSKIVNLPFKDKPYSWGKSRSSDGYCFKSYGFDDAVKSLFKWIGYTEKDIYEDHKLPGVDKLN